MGDVAGGGAAAGARPGAPSADGVPMSPGAALAAAEQTNPQLLAPRARPRPVDEAVPQALSGWRPKVNFYGRAKPGPDATNTDSRYSPERRVPQLYTLTVTQDLYTSGRVHDRVAQAKLQVRAVRAASEAQVLLAAATADVDVVRDRDILVPQRSRRRCWRGR